MKNVLKPRLWLFTYYAQFHNSEESLDSNTYTFGTKPRKRWLSFNSCNFYINEIHVFCYIIEICNHHAIFLPGLICSMLTRLYSSVYFCCMAKSKTKLFYDRQIKINMLLLWAQRQPLFYMVKLGFTVVYIFLESEMGRVLRVWGLINDVVTKDGILPSPTFSSSP